MKKQFTNKARYLGLKLTAIIFALLLFASGQSWGQVNITPIRTDVSGFSSWTDLNVAGTTYLQLTTATSSTISPAMNFDSYTSEALNFKARTFGGPSAAQATITVSINTGSGWTVLGTRVPGTSTLTAMTAFDLSSYNGTSIKIKFETLGAGSSKGAGIDDISITGTLSGATPPTLTADASNNDVDNNIDITFTDDPTWRAAITAVKIGTTALTVTTDYVISSGNIQLKPSGGNVLLTASGSKSVSVEATGYTTASVTQVINAGVPTNNSTATINSALALGASRTITCTAKDQYNNLVSGYTFKYDATITDNNTTTDESYTIDGTAQTTTSTDISVVAATNVSGVATFNAVIPATVDGDDGISIQVQLNNGTTNIGTAFSYTQLSPQITLTGIDPGSASVQQNSTNNVIYRIKVDVINNSSDLTALSAITAGNYVAADISTNGFKLWYSSDATFGGDINIKSVPSSSTGTGEVISFTGFNQTFTVGTAYLFITADISAVATVTNNISCEATANNDFTFTASPTFSGSSFTAANLHSVSSGPTTLQAGDIAIIEFNSSSPDKISFITYVQLNPNTIINFTDNGYSDATTPRTGEGFLTYTAPTTIAAGTVISWYNGMTITGTGWNSSAPSNFALAAGDQLFAYQGTWGSGQTLIFGLNCGNSGWLTSGTASSNTSYLPSSLTANVTAITFSEANGNYNLISAGTISALKSLVANPANWTKSSSAITTPSWSFSIGSSTIVNQNVTVQDLSISNSETLTINAGKQLTVSGTLTNNAGVSGLVLKSDATGTASLINSTAGVSATVERYLTGNVFHQLGLPISNTIAAGTSAGQTGDVFKYCTIDYYNESSNTYTGLTASDNVTPDKGYVVKYVYGASAPAYRTLSFTGTLNTGDKPYSISYSGTGANDPFKGYNMIPNPYPSAINGDIDTWAKTNVSNSIWVWDQSSTSPEPTGNYLTWNGSTGTLTDGIIPAMQAFFIQTNNANPLITIPNSARTHSNQAYYKSTVTDELTLKVKGNNYSDAIIVTFTPNATNNFDNNFDVRKLYGLQAAPQLFSLCNSEKLSINGLAPITTSVALPVGLQVGNNGNYTINADGVNTFATCSSIILEDLKTNTTQNLMQNPVYSFAAATTDNANRFVLHFATAVGVNEIGNSNGSIYAYDNSIYVNANEQIKQISVYNAMGQLVKTLNNVNGLQKINMNGNATGYYIVRVVSNKNVYSEKVLIK